MRNVRPAELRVLLAAQQAVVLDVRQDEEWAICHLPGAVHVPMAEVPQRLDEIKHHKNLVVVCHHGIRSERVARFLEQNGFEGVSHLAGGLAAWAQEVDPSMPQY